MSGITIDPCLCTKCGTCVRICPENILVQIEQDGIPATQHEELCIACGHCVAICPEGALQHADFPEGAVGPIDTNAFPSADQLLELFRARRSMRVFEDKAVEREVIEKVIDAAHWAPAGHNIREMGVVVVQDPAALEQIAKATARHFGRTARQLRNPVLRSLLRLVMPTVVDGAMHFLQDFEMVAQASQRGEDTILYNAPCFLAFHSGTNISFPEANANLALHNATLIAEALGLGSFWAGWVVAACRRDKGIARLMGIPSGRKVQAAMVLGYPELTFEKWVARPALEVKWV